ncbi:hypothetical protein [Sphingosinicella sp. BN140058]|uniref:hypothetical protein n=1 Tax=Sphingosinicella sp. BN140058 TaxID=1892855 RepID=UPI0010114570|nr:hypothetical protein [Sphingosinicella sp. BN140058]QAY76985.1 hypothetical protein ETR14_11105 [Sphingosinicella sp. BN140058]
MEQAKVTGSDIEGDTEAGDKALRRACLSIAAALLTASLLITVASPGGLAAFLYQSQDKPVILVYALVLASLALLSARIAAFPAVRLGRWSVAVLALLLALCLWAGTYLIFGNYALSRDEHMVLFDGLVYQNGRLAQPVSQLWRPFTDALTPDFLLPISDSSVWISSYLPGHAALRAFWGMVLDPALLNPVLAGAGACALWGVTGRLFGVDDRGTRAVSVLLYLTSVQMLVTAMTPYAMTAHLALNLMWLALFLRGDVPGYAGALLLGFVGTGLHQVVFHPLFAFPFMILLWARNERRTAALFICAYAAFGLFWISYPKLVSYAFALPAAPGGAGLVGFVEARVLPLLHQWDWSGLSVMLLNLLRFAAWQNLALLPLVLLAWRAVRRGDGVAAALIAGIGLTLATMLVILPYQGLGWGYRYLHGLLGSFAILGGYGWRELAGDRIRARFFLAATTAITVLLAIPLQLWHARAFEQPYRRLDATVQRIDAEFAILDDSASTFVVDVVRNRPDLSNRPLRFASRGLDRLDVITLCSRGRIAFVGREEVDRAGITLAPPAVHFEALRQAVADRPCSLEMRID